MIQRLRRMLRYIVPICAFSFVMTMPAYAAKVKIGVPENVRWEESRACWDSVEDAYEYEVQLYKDGTKVSSTSSTSDTSMEMSGSMNEKGKYTFRVRVRERVSDEYGRYSALSGTFVQEKTVKTTYRRTTTSTTPGKEAGERSPGPGVVGKNWRQDTTGWWYDNADGSFLSGGWYQLDQKWYYFNAAGYLQTGWITAEGNQYYSNADGSRVSGWAEIDGGYYYFNDNGVFNPGMKN